MPTRRPSAFQIDALQYLEHRDTVLTSEKPKKDLAKSLKEFISQNGQEDEKGSLVVKFPSPVTINDVTYTGLMLEKRPSTLIDEDEARELVEGKNLMDAIPTTTVYDWEEGLYRLLALKKITEKELASVEQEEVSWALQVMK